MKAIKDNSAALTARLTCYAGNADKSSASEFNSRILSETANSKYAYKVDKNLITYPITMDVQARNSSLLTDMGTWTMDNKFVKADDYKHKEIPR